MDKKINYLVRTFDDYKNALIEYSQKYYPDLAIEFDDASIASWLIDINADIADSLEYYIDRSLQETNINSAKEASSIFSIARSNGFKIPGPRGSMAEVAFYCIVPVYGDTYDSRYCPIIKRGTKVSSGNQYFEVLDDIDFSKQFDTNGNSNRTIQPVYTTNGFLASYRITKTAVVVAGDTRIYKRTISRYDIKPFMEILLPVENVMNVESVLVFGSTNIISNPTYAQFYMPNEVCEESDGPIRFFEVDSLAQQKIWGDANEEPVIYGYKSETGDVDYTYSITRGEWKTLKHKFMTEYTDKGYLKVIFGNGVENYVPSEMKDFSKYQISRVINNTSLGVLPNADSTIFILYRVGGGESSNLAAGAISSISQLNVEFGGNLDSKTMSAVRASISCKSTTPSVSGKDMPSVDEIKYLMKYNSGAQNRCVTVKDYVSRILQMPPKYGTPFRVGAMEANNKIMVYVLGIDNERKLDSRLPSALSENIQNYLAGYRSINDFVEIKSGRIINLSFEIDFFVDKNYNKSDVATNVINTVKKYMDISSHNMGDDIFVGDIEKEVTKIDGVISIIEFRVYNEIDESRGYSPTPIQQSVYEEYAAGEKRYRVNLEASDRVLYCDGDSMFEIKRPEVDIKLMIKER